MSKELNYILNDECQYSCKFCFKDSDCYSKDKITVEDILSDVTDNTDSIIITSVSIDKYEYDFILALSEKINDKIKIFVETMPLSSQFYFVKLLCELQNVSIRVIYNSSISSNKKDVLYVMNVLSKKNKNIICMYVFFEETKEEIEKLEKIIVQNESSAVFKIYSSDEKFLELHNRNKGNIRIQVSTSFKPFNKKTVKSCKNI